MGWAGMGCWVCGALSLCWGPRSPFKRKVPPVGGCFQRPLYGSFGFVWLAGCCCQQKNAALQNNALNHQPCMVYHGYGMLRMVWMVRMVWYGL